MFLFAAICTLIGKATDSNLKEFAGSLGIEPHRQELCSILSELQGIITDAEGRSESDQAASRWLHDLNVVMHEVEDAVDNLRYDARSKKLEADIQPEEMAIPFSTILGYSSRNYCGHVGNIPADTQLKGVLERIEAIVANMNRFGFLMATEFVGDVHSWPRIHLYVHELAVIGRSNDLEDIVTAVLSELMAERENVAVVSLVGTCGSGVSTLAQLVCDDVRIRDHFQLTLTVSISSDLVSLFGDFEVPRVAKKVAVLAAGCDNPLGFIDMKVIRGDLHRELNDKRYLIILEHVPNKNRLNWVQLKFLLDCGRPGSAIIVTTRSEAVSNVVEAISTHKIRGLNEDHLWTIFRQWAFGMGVVERPELVAIGKQLVVNKCCGLPLLATILGALLSYKKEEREWSDVLESIIPDNADSRNENAVLKLSYRHLPSYMKQCLALCVIFPKGYEIEGDTLIQLWMAHDFIPSEGNMDAEAKGIEIFNELAWRGFLQHVRKKEKKLIFGGFITHVVCRMHDLIYDFVKSIIGSEYATLLNMDQQNNLSNETLHVSTYYKKGIVSLIERCSSVRTLLDFGLTTDHTEQILHWQKDNSVLDVSMPNSLRALSLHCASISYIDAIPGILKHLRYLDLSDCCYLMELSESFCTLHDLQTLNLTNCRDLACLPEGMRHMRSLRYLYLDGCYSLNCLPPGLLDKLTCLHPLSTYRVDREIWR